MKREKTEYRVRFEYFNKKLYLCRKQESVMQIELATIQDVPAILDLQRKAFGSLCEELNWMDAPPLTETLEQAYDEFTRYVTLKALNEDGLIVGSIMGSLAGGSLYLGRLMVLPNYQRQGIGGQLFREIQSRLPHSRAWLCTCQNVRPPYEFYLREGFKPYKSETVGPGLTWAYMEKYIKEPATDSLLPERSIRPARFEDIPEIMQVMAAAKQIMRQSGNMHQWGEGYPSESVIEADIRKEGGFVIEEGGKIVGYFAFLPSPEPTYATIYEGKWLDDDKPYHVVHRIASYPEVRGIFSSIIDFCFSHDINIRIDTHRDNKIMQHNLQKHGFSYQGIIYLLSGDERLAYQKIVTE